MGRDVSTGGVDEHRVTISISYLSVGETSAYPVAVKGATTQVLHFTEDINVLLTDEIPCNWILWLLFRATLLDLP